jgi:hypothetical protein
LRVYNKQGDFKISLKKLGNFMQKTFYKKYNRGGGGICFGKKSNAVLKEKKNCGRFFRVLASSQGSAWALLAKMVPIEVPVASGSGEVRPPYNKAPPGPRKGTYVHWLFFPSFFSCWPLLLADTWSR